MIIEAFVKIELKSDGTWQIVGLKALTEPSPPVVTPKPGVVEKHFRNRDRVRKKRALEKKPRGPRKPHHCSDCGKAHHNCKTHPFH